MKLGGFGKLNDYEKIKNSGYDFAELDLPEITELDEESFEKDSRSKAFGVINVLKNCGWLEFEDEKNYRQNA